ncbi:DUF2059 domain-containing protein [Psychrobacter lutiphocae]|uniref:DUF2059 domain-containing protein n=1 Tax=Psychrobacter lutiphocae TaxID=540500 RepID=UPI00036798B7|nr:DUF2059 domain-containing protein [Psychrobacter lutiphocae]
MQKLFKLSGLSLAAMLVATTPALAELTVDSATYKVGKTTHLGSVGQQVPSDASLVKLMQIMRMAQMMQTMAGSQGEMLESAMQMALKDKGLDELTATQKQQIEEVLTKYTQQMLTETNSKIIDIAQQHFLVVAKKHYNQAEVDAQIQFYSSDIGQSILDKQPEFMQEYMMAMMPEAMTAAIEAREKLTPKLMQDLRQILK